MARNSTAAMDWQLELCEIKQRGGYLLKSGLWADCRFLVCGTEIQAHKLVLAMASPVFEAMFYGPVAEGSAPIAIPDIHADVFNALLEYIYTDNIVIKSCQKACELYYSAQKYMLPHLKTVCVTFLASNLTFCSVGKIFEFALLVDEKGLVKECQKKIQNEAKLVISANGFDELLPDTVLRIFSMDHLNIDSEKQLFQAAMSYAFGDGKSRTRIKYNYTVNNIRGMQIGDMIPSRTFYLCNLPWRVVLLRRCSNSVSIRLQCARERGPYPIFCNVKGTITLLTQNGRSPLVWDIHRLFLADTEWKSVDKNGRLKWNQLVDSRLGYVKDNCITVEVNIRAKIPLETTHNRSTGSLNTSSLSSLSLDPQLSSRSLNVSASTDRGDHNRLFRNVGNTVGREDYAARKEMARKLLKRIRLLTLTPQEIVGYPALKSLLTDKEMLAILMNVTTANTREPMPEGFCTSRVKRSLK